MTKHNPKNERIKHQYLTHLRDAKGRSEATIDAAAKALHRYEVYTRLHDFRLFHKDKAVGFKKHLAAQRAQRSGEPLSKSTLHATLDCLKKFYLWLADQSGHRSRLIKTDFDYFNLSRKDARIAKAVREPRAPTVEQVKQVILTMPAITEIEHRDRAVIAFALLTGARDGAIASMKLKHVDLAANRVNQDAREVKTKLSKTFATFLLPIGDDIRTIVADWITYLRQVKLWGDDDPLFAQTRVVRGTSSHFEAAGLERKHWSNASPIRDIFRKAFANAGFEYFNPHSLRRTLVEWAKSFNPTIEEFKAFSQNLGHKSPMTTLESYGAVATPRQGEIISGLAKPQETPASDFEKLVKAVARKVREEDYKDPRV